MQSTNVCSNPAQARCTQYNIEKTTDLLQVVGKLYQEKTTDLQQVIGKLYQEKTTDLLQVVGKLYQVPLTATNN
jgi:hypothetical protein